MHHHTAPPVPFPVDRLYGDRLKCNINTKPDGTVWLIAQNACNYSSGSGSSVVLDEVRAGTPPTKNASDRGLSDDTNGNPWFFNFENDHAGDGGPMPAVQHDAIVQATRVVLDHYGLGPGNVISHAEWTARKQDPYWNGSRRAIEEIRRLLEVHMFIAADGRNGWPTKGPVVEYWQHFLRKLDPTYDPGDGGWGDATTSEFAAELAKFSPGDPVIGPGEMVALQARLVQKVAPQGAAGDHDHDGRYVRDVSVSR